MLRVGVLYRVGDALDFLSRHPLSEQQFLTSFGDWEGVSGSAVLETCTRLGWIATKPTSELLITPTGKSLCEVRRPEARLRLQLEHIISLTRPTWAALAVRGRNAVVSYAPKEAVQCLSDAALLDGTDEEVVGWWDRLARYYRTLRDDDRMTTGRIGERCSSEYELRRTGFKPNWVALDTNDAGYDLITRIAKEDARRLLIEVKTSTLNWEDADAILTRHEWNVLSQAANACLDLWCVAGRPYLFLRMAVQELSPKIPVEQTECQWLTVSLPFRVLGHPTAISNQ
jgi:hypothetical protein